MSEPARQRGPRPATIEYLAEIMWLIDNGETAERACARVGHNIGAVEKRLCRSQMWDEYHKLCAAKMLALVPEKQRGYRESHD